MNAIEKIIKEIDTLGAAEALDLISKTYGTEAVFSTSFGLEDQAISHLIFAKQLQIEVFTLDTGRLFPETYSTWNQTLEKYKSKIKTYFPNESAVEKLITNKGPLSFYESIGNRKECCFIRKVEPLKRALSGKKIWITGIRSEQSPERNDIERIEWDEQHQLIKFHPLLFWKENELASFIAINNIPINPLHNKNYPSIGCQPCTRAVKAGEDIRSGRWWWEDATKKECGLHSNESIKQ